MSFKDKLCSKRNSVENKSNLEREDPLGAGEMTQLLRAFCALAEDSCSVPSTHTVPNNDLYLQFQVILCPPLISRGIRHKPDAQIDKHRKHYTHWKSYKKWKLYQYRACSKDYYQTKATWSTESILILNSSWILFLSGSWSFQWHSCQQL